nr:pentatricopeptide repeat-containing protein At4g38150-like [Ipomoea batatas]
MTKEAFKGCEEYFHLSGVTESANLTFPNSVQRVRNVVKTLQLLKLRSFCSSVKFDDHQHYNNTPNSPNPNTPQSNFSPPEPIPNRPLRDESRRPPFIPRGQRQARRPSASFNRPDGQDRNQSPQASSGEDFLKRFQLGFDHEKSDPNHTNPLKGESTESSAEESSPPLQDADEIFKKMKETGLIPNAVAMLDGLCKDGLVQEAMKLFGLMREKGTLPEVVIYTAVVEGFCKAYNHDDAVRIFRKMQSNGIIPNAFTYSILIQGLCQGKRLEDAFMFCLEMLEAGHSPNLATFIGLVDGYCKEKTLEDAQNMIQTLRQKGYYLDEKAVREYLNKKGPFLPLVWEATLGKKASPRQSLF